MRFKMSLRKYMHPKNRYKKYPDFKLLAIVYPEFQKVTSVDLTGEVRLDFKNEETVRVLTQVLLKHDFNLKVVIPKKNLVPTLPLRMNYVLWIEDLMDYASHTDMETVMGIDIGTGAVCIYPLLFARMYKCHMIATEIDEESVQTAIEHVKNNGFEDMITVRLVDGQNVLKDIVEDDKLYQFTMCNPPFFDAGENADKTVKELPPRNAPTGNEKELTTEGGEKQFVAKMIEESLEIKDRIKIYTTMLGLKSNLSYLIKLLRKVGIENSTWTEFCQGHTKRWGLAWTFLTKDVLDLTKAPVIRKLEDSFKKISRDDFKASIMFPLKENFSSFTNVIETLEKIFEDVKIKVTKLNVLKTNFDGWACELEALENTWYPGRKKRRLAQRLSKELLEKTTVKAEKSNNSAEEITEVPQADIETSTNNVIVKEDVPEEPDSTKPLLVCRLYVIEIKHEDTCEESNIRMCMVFGRGHGGKTVMLSLRQYLMNKLRVNDYIDYPNIMNKKRKKRKRKLHTAFPDNASDSKDDLFKLPAHEHNAQFF